MVAVVSAEGVEHGGDAGDVVGAAADEREEALHRVLPHQPHPRQAAAYGGEVGVGGPLGVEGGEGGDCVHVEEVAQEGGHVEGAVVGWVVDLEEGVVGVLVESEDGVVDDAGPLGEGGVLTPAEGLAVGESHITAELRGRDLQRMPRR